MKYNSLLLILAWFLIVSRIVFKGENASPPPVTEAGPEGYVSVHSS